MTLPLAVSYEPPAAVPTSRVDWTLLPQRAALLVHDMQAYFTRVFDPQAPALRQAVDSTAALIAAAREAGVPIAFTAQPGNQDRDARGLLADMWGPGIRDDEEHTRIIDELAPQPGDEVFVKHRYSAFARSPFEDWLRAQGRDQLVITGIYAHIGIVATATEAFMRDIQPFVVADAVADFSADDHERALHQVARTCGVVLPAKQAVSLLAADTAPSGPWEVWLAAQLGHLIGDPVAGERLVADPELDVFKAGLDSVRSFSLLDDLADRGVEIDFTEFVSAGCTAYLLEEIGRSGVTTP